MNEPVVPAQPRGVVSQLARYAMVGVASNLVGYLVYLLITHWGGGPKLTMTCLYTVGAAIGFLGNRHLTFAHAERGLVVGVRYLLAHASGYLINLALLHLLVDRLGWAHQLAQGLAILVVAAFLFTAFRLFVFPTFEKTEGRQP
ncbi:MAG: GtrA family protein [Hyphomicrobiales bacterium]|nr:MAG: GtrA family protein [Hyphomicrobiales bacterium]